MSKIIYGVAGQGFGHSTRSKEILRHLKSQGHEILVFTYNQALFFLGDEFEIFEIPGLGLTYKDGRLSYRWTFWKNTKQLAKQSWQWKKIITRFDEFNPDLIITDFESTVAYLAKLKKRPLISIDNQHQLTNTKIVLPKKYFKDLLIVKAVVKSMVWGDNYYFITTFFETPIAKEKTFLFPPILRREILELKPEKQDYVLVYHTDNFDCLVEELKKINCRFVVFGSNMEKVEGNIEFKNYSTYNFLNYLASSKAIIGTAGLSLITESLYLKKPYLALPVKKQIEQIVNAHYLKRQGYGDFAFEFTKEKFDEFIKNIGEFENNLNRCNYTNNEAIFRKLDEVIEDEV
ncbi:MAG: MJ1255/VC2487 family glycosyltransferase [Patescibacteria group bacterium]